MIQKILLQILKYIAKIIVTTHHPFIIWITGTVGKSTITSHIGKFLTIHYGHKNVLFSHEHYNWEYGLPLTIIWEKTGWKNPFVWLYIFIKGFIKIFLPFPKYLILEYGIDHPWEMDFLLSIASPDIVILTEVAPNHLEQFGSFELYRKEKFKLIENATHVIAHCSHKQFIEREVIYYGIWSMSDVDISHVKVDISGTHAQVNIKKSTHDISLPTFWIFHIENILPLYMLSEILWIDINTIWLYLKDFQPESGRSWLLSWINGSIIIDGSYNGGYLSIREWIVSLLTLLPTQRVIFLLWDMRELGDEAEKTHKLLATDINTILPHDANVVFYFVWPLTEKYLIPHLSSSFEVHHTVSSISAGKDIAQILKRTHKMSTVIFVKWSQNTIFLEEWIKEFLEDPMEKKKLCRQSNEWLKKKALFFSKIS
jgi:UDP-N-acetylmuramoyl-tripeptide--D-alanyl-D-alanine ligase